MNMVKQSLLIPLTLSLLLGLTALAGCTPNESSSNEAGSSAQTGGTESGESGDETKPVLLAVSFGSSYNETRDLTIGAIETALQEAYPDYEVRRAFTSQTIIDILKERENLQIDNVTEAMERLIADGVKEVVIQPTHIMSGYEYDDIVKEVSAYASRFQKLQIGAPLLSQDADYDALIQVLTRETAAYNNGDTAIVFMGHGTEHEANAVYSTLQQKITAAGYDHYFIGTVEATPTLEDVLALVQDSGATKVLLTPLMIVAGDHATNDMAGDEADSWKSVFTNAGYQVECLLKGLGEYQGIQQMIIDHAGDAMNGGNAVSNVDTANLRQSLTASQIADGTYEIAVESSSSMFRIVKCVLHVADGAMSATITMSGDGYDKVYPGTGEEALAASSDDYIPAVLDGEGAVTFALPLDALNTETDCAAWSINKEKWYDRTLVFLSDAIPTDAVKAQ